MLILACNKDKDPCDVKHVVIDGECVPDYIFPSNKTPDDGDKYYHKSFGVIIYNNGHWTDEFGDVIEDLEIKAN